MAKARRVRIDPDAPFAAAASETVKVRGPELLEFLEGTLDGSDIEQLHSMRVASRRLRAALEVYEGCFDRSPTGGCCVSSRTPPTRSPMRATSTSRSTT